MKLLDKEISLKIIYVDNHILVVEKPQGLLTQPDDTKNPSLEALVKQYLKEKFSKPGSVFLHAIHRLDKQVSGLVLFARTSKALSRLNEQMRNQQIKKKYKAIVEGILKNKKDRLVDYLLHLNHKAAVTVKEDKNGKKAELMYEVIKETRDTSLLEIELLTGRYHQIRVQLSHIGHPILGDEKYNSQREKDGIALHSSYLEFTHPVSKEKMVFESEVTFTIYRYQDVKNIPQADPQESSVN